MKPSDVTSIYKVGQRVELATDYARMAFMGRKNKNGKGRLIGFDYSRDKILLVVVLDGAKTKHKFHPDFIKPCEDDSLMEAAAEISLDRF